MNRLLIAASIMIASGLAQAQYPDRPVRMLVGFAAGGSADLVGRVAAQALGDRLGKPVIVENRPGAGSLTAAQAVARADPNGYTILLGSIALSVQVGVNPGMAFDPAKELAPVALIAQAPNVLVVHPGLPVRSVSELVAYAKSGKPVNFASSGVATTLHLAGEMLKSAVGAPNMAHVPYKGSGPALSDLMGGQVQMMFDNLATALPLIQGGKLRALAVTTRTRSAKLADVPTMLEAGFDNFEVSVWFGLFAPAGTPRPLIERLGREMNAALGDPAVIARLDPLNVDVMKSESPEKMGEFFGADIQRWKKAVAEAGVKLEGN
jgi:tripartite-type tricarboxylate transporter receptor subunit TctC